MTDGASAIYGSDAVAGVVNIVTRRAFEGAETSARYGQSTDGGAGHSTASQLFGHTWTDGNALIDYEYDDEQGLDASQRSWIGPENGPYSLVPENHRQSVYLAGTQDIGALTTISLSTLYSTREFKTDGLQLSTDGFVPNSEYASGHANLFWSAATIDRELPSAWNVTGAATHSSMNQFRSAAVFPDGPSGAHVGSTLAADSDISDIEVEAGGPAGGALRVALGAGYRSESFRDAVPSIEPLAPVEERRTDLSAYAEATLPIIDGESTFTWARRLEISGAYRLDSYSHFAAAHNPKLGWAWEPKAGLTVRGTAGTSFKVPLISQLDAPTTSYTTFLPSNEPGGKPSDVLVINGGNPLLHSQNSRSITTGIDWAPLNLPAVRGSVTYFNVTYDDRIQSQNIEDKPLGSQPQLLPLSSLNPSLDAVIPYFQSPGFQQDAAGLGPSGVAAIVDNQLANATSTIEQGFRIDARYGHEATPGRFDLWLSGVYLIEDRTQAATYVPETDVVGTIGEPPRLRLRGSLSWQRGLLAANLMVNYVGAYENSLFRPAESVASWTTANLALILNLPDEPSLTQGLHLALNIDNITNRRPPFVSTPAGDLAIGRSPIPFDGTNASPVGRFLSLQLSKRW